MTVYVKQDFGRGRNFNMEQRAVIKFNAKLGKSASETFRSMQQVYGSQCLGRTAVFEWHKRFLEGRETLEDDKKSGEPEMIEKVRDFVANDRNASIKMMEEALNISRETIRTILHEDLDWSLLHDNAPSHTSLIVRQCLARNHVSVLRGNGTLCAEKVGSFFGIYYERMKRFIKKRLGAYKSTCL
ncbi:SETMR methyltransferase, partial [Acromyrmex heyeri]